MEARDKILQAAATLFADVGFRGATTRRIAQEAGVNEITLFRHFGSKERLLHEAIANAGVRPRTVPLPEEPRHPRAELLAWARDHLDHLREKRSFIRTCMAEVEEHPEMIPDDNPTTAATHTLRDYLKRLKTRKIATAKFDPEIAAPMFVGILFADAMGRDVMPDLFTNDPERALHQYVDLFLRAIGVTRLADAAPQERTS
jgi:AcrR family transcriptional regulator